MTKLNKDKASIMTILKFYQKNIVTKSKHYKCEKTFGQNSNCDQTQVVQNPNFVSNQVVTKLHIWKLNKKIWLTNYYKLWQKHMW